MFFGKKIVAVFLVMILSAFAVMPVYAANDRIYEDEEIIDDLDEEKVGWVKEDDVWSCTDPYGEPMSGWAKRDNYTYFLNKNGVMRTGWVKSQGKWYYLYTEEDAKDKLIDKALVGTLARDTWIDNYYVDADGVQKKIKK